jgi:hypothetical protein
MTENRKRTQEEIEEILREGDRKLIAVANRVGIDIHTSGVSLNNGEVGVSILIRFDSLEKLKEALAQIKTAADNKLSEVGE